MKLSVVATLYQSANYIQEFYQRVTTEAQKLVQNDYEIILVNDGSPDDSLEIAVDLAKQDAKLTIINLSRNFGHHKAIMTGLTHTTGELVFLIDCDLEEQPEWLETFHTVLKENQSDVTFGSQETRRGGSFEKLSGKWFYSLVNFLSDSDLPKNPTVARLMTQKYVQALASHKERELYLGGLMFLTGFKQTPVTVKKLDTSETTYSLRKKISATVNSITSLSYKPLNMIFYFGVCIGTISFFITAIIIIQTLFINKPAPGWASITVSIWLACGLIMSSLGVIGLYISKIFSEVKARPYTIIQDIYSKGGDEN